MANTKKKNINTKRTADGDFNLATKHYKQLGEFEVYKTEKKITKIFGLYNKYAGNRDLYLKA